MLLGLLSIIRAPLYLRSSWCYIRSKFFLPLVSWAWWHWTNRCPSLQLYYWLGHTTHEMVSKMTYNVSSGTLNPTIPYHRHLHLFIVPFTSVIGLAWQCQYGKHLQRMSDKCSGGGIIWLCMVYTTWHYTKTETWHKRAEAEAHWQLGLYFSGHYRRAQWETWLRVCVKAKGRHFKHLLWSSHTTSSQSLHTHQNRFFSEPLTLLRGRQHKFSVLV